MATETRDGWAALRVVGACLVRRAVVVAMSRRVRVAAQLFLVLGIALALLRLRTTWGGTHAHVSAAGWAFLSGAAALVVAALVGSGFVWISILRDLGATPKPWWFGVFLQAQLGKYVPGAVWQYAGRGAIGAAHGVPLRLVARSIPIELLATSAAAAAFAAALLGWWGLAATAGALGAAAYGRSVARKGRHAFADAAVSASLLYAVTWPLIGLSFWLTAKAFVAVPWHDLAYYTGAFAVAWVVGLVAFFAPGGVGVREAVLVALLRGRLGSADALVVALASRGVLTLADVVAAGLGFGTVRLSRTGAAAAEGAHGLREGSGTAIT